MSVLIKGMDIPDHCLRCPFMVSRDNDDCILQTEEENLMIESFEQMKEHCPLVSVPTPHGRLVDADDVLTQVQKGKCKNSFELGKESGWNLAIEYVGHFAPTIIEAEGKSCS